MSRATQFTCANCHKPKPKRHLTQSVKGLVCDQCYRHLHTHLRKPRGTK